MVKGIHKKYVYIIKQHSVTEGLTSKIRVVICLLELMLSGTYNIVICCEHRGEDAHPSQRVGFRSKIVSGRVKKGSGRWANNVKFSYRLATQRLLASNYYCCLKIIDSTRTMTEKWTMPGRSIQERTRLCIVQIIQMYNYLQN